MITFVSKLIFIYTNVIIIDVITKSH